MKIKDIINEAAMSVAIQTRYPVSPGARSLLGSRWRYDTVVNRSHTKNLTAACDQLEYNLKYLPKLDADHADIIVHTIGEKFRINDDELIKAFRNKYNCSPFEYAVKYKKSREGQPVLI